MVLHLQNHSLWIAPNINFQTAIVSIFLLVSFCVSRLRKSNCMFDNERIKLFEYQYIFDTKLVSLDSPDCSSLKDHNWIVHAQLCAQIASPGVQSVLFSQLGRGTEILRSGFTVIHLVCDWLVSGTDCSFEWAVDVYLASLLQNCTTHLVVSACFSFCTA